VGLLLGYYQGLKVVGSCHLSLDVMPALCPHPRRSARLSALTNTLPSARVMAGRGNNERLPSKGVPSAPPPAPQVPQAQTMPATWGTASLPPRENVVGGEASPQPYHNHWPPHWHPPILYASAGAFKCCQYLGPTTGEVEYSTHKLGPLLHPSPDLLDHNIPCRLSCPMPQWELQLIKVAELCPQAAIWRKGKAVWKD
jgi:hypothetical protein